MKGPSTHFSVPVSHFLIWLHTAHFKITYLGGANKDRYNQQQQFKSEVAKVACGLVFFDSSVSSIQAAPGF